MKIKTEVFLLTLLAIVFSLGSILIQNAFRRETSRAIQNARHAHQIFEDVFRLSVLGSDYLLHPGERAKIQWQLTHRALGSRLEKNFFKQNHGNNAVQEIQTLHQAIAETFSQLTSVTEAAEPVSPELRTRLSSQLFIHLHAMATNASLLSNQSFAERDAILNRANLISFFLFVFLLLLLACLMFFFYRSIVDPLTKLYKGTEVVGAGDLDYKLGTQAQNEIGQVARAFDTMTTKLKSEHEHLEERVRERTRELEARTKELEAFTYSVSHDLRAPLRAIDGFAKILSEEYGKKMNTEGNRLLTVIQSNAVQLGRLIDDLLTLSRLGRQELKTQKIDMSQLARSVYEELIYAIPERKIEFRLADLPPARVDLSLFRQCWANYLSNAIKFTRPKKVATIEVGGSKQGNELVYFVKDNGVGYDMQYQDKLFGTFQRLHAPEEFEGTGIGLAIVSRIVGKHGGRVWSEGRVGEGATFYFALPVG